MARSRFTLHGVLLCVIGLTVLVGLVPAGVILDRRLAASLLERARVDLETAPRLLADRRAGRSDALSMRAEDLSHAPGLAAAVANGDRAGVLSSIESVRPMLGTSTPLVAATQYGVQLGPFADSVLVAATRSGQMPVRLTSDGAAIRNLALAPIVFEGRWVGAAGVAAPLDDDEVTTLKGLVRSDVVIATAGGDTVVASTIDTARARRLLAVVDHRRDSSAAQEVSVEGERYLVVSARLADAGVAFFVRAVAQELAILPTLRRTAALSALGATALALLLGASMAMRVSRPVRELALAASATAQGRFDAPLPESRIDEVATVAERFRDMRRALRAQLLALRESNEMLQERSARLAALQSDLMRRDRLAAAGRLVVQLAHEIRNPVASLRNCLEVIRRRVSHDPEAVDFADLAIDELLRMHELAEQMLDLSRPRDSAHAACSPAVIARDVVRLLTAGVAETELSVEVAGDPSIEAAIAGDALKQVLLNLVQNAREAVTVSGDGERGTRVTIAVSMRDAGVRVVVEDNGPGVSHDLRDRIFDPFFSTKSDMQGVGLGLFVAEGLVRSAGGSISVGAAPGGGAAFVVDLPLAADGGDDRGEG